MILYISGLEELPVDLPDPILFGNQVAGHLLGLSNLWISPVHIYSPLATFTSATVFWILIGVSAAMWSESMGAVLLADGVIVAIVFLLAVPSGTSAFAGAVLGFGYCSLASATMIYVKTKLPCR